jgi:hypothetical protein
LQAADGGHEIGERGVEFLADESSDHREALPEEHHGGAIGAEDLGEDLSCGGEGGAEIFQDGIGRHLGLQHDGVPKNGQSAGDVAGGEGIDGGLEARHGSGAAEEGVGELLANGGGIDAGEALGDGIERGNGAVEDAGGEICELPGDDGDFVGDGVEDSGAAVHDVGHAAELAAGGFEFSAEVGEKGQKLAAGLSEDFHGEGGAFAGVLDACDARGEDLHLLGGGLACQIGEREAEGIHHLGLVFAACRGVFHELLELVHALADFFRADAGVVECALEKQEIASGLAGAAGEVGEAAAEVEGVAKLGDGIADPGECGVHDAGEGFDCELADGGGSGDLAETGIEDVAALLAGILQAAEGALDGAEALFDAVCLGTDLDGDGVSFGHGVRRLSSRGISQRSRRFSGTRRGACFS